MALIVIKVTKNTQIVSPIVFDLKNDRNSCPTISIYNILHYFEHKQLMQTARVNKCTDFCEAAKGDLLQLTITSLSDAKLKRCLHKCFCFAGNKNKIASWQIFFCVYLVFISEKYDCFHLKKFCLSWRRKDRGAARSGPATESFFLVTEFQIVCIFL